MSISLDFTEGQHIFLNTSDMKKSVLNGSNPYEKYIICMNDQLTCETHTLRKKIDELTSKIDSIEDENEKYDISKRYTKGLLHNLVELEKLHNNSKNIYKNLFNLSNNSHQYKFITDIIFLIYAYLIFYFGFSILLIIMLQIIICSSFFFIQDKQKIKSFQAQLIELDLKITKIKNSQDFIGDYIDNI